MEATLYELIFTVCSIVHGAHCSDLSPVPLEANTPLIGCAIASQVEGAKWVFSHPNSMCIRPRANPSAASQNCRSAMQISAQHDFGFLWRVVELALVEAGEREIELTASEITSRLFNAYEKGVRDEDELKDAIVLNFPTVYLQ